jgi:hypothetical protein
MGRPQGQLLPAAYKRVVELPPIIKPTRWDGLIRDAVKHPGDWYEVDAANVAVRNAVAPGGSIFNALHQRHRNFEPQYCQRDGKPYFRVVTR